MKLTQTKLKFIGHLKIKKKSNLSQGKYVTFLLCYTTSYFSFLTFKSSKLLFFFFEKCTYKK